MAVVDDENGRVAAAMMAYEVIEWYLRRCRESGVTDWADIEHMLRMRPDCREEHVAAIRAAWEMHL